MKPKKPKLYDDLGARLLMIVKLMYTNKDIINESTKNGKHKSLKDIDIILKINTNNPDQSALFLNKNRSLLLTYKNDFMKFGIYDIWMKCCLESFLVMKRKFESFLSKNIDTNIITIYEIINEINKCLTFDISYFNDCEQLNALINNDPNNEKYLLYKQIQISFNTIHNFIQHSILGKQMSINDLHQILELIKKHIIDNKFTEKGIYNWNVIITKIKCYIRNTKPFDIFNIRQIDSVCRICNEILHLLIQDVQCFTIKLIECHKNYTAYKNELRKIRQTPKYHKNNEYKQYADNLLTTNLNTCFILSNNIKLLNLQINEVTKKNKLINELKGEPTKQLELLADLNNFIFDHYNSMIDSNTDLNIGILKNNNTCFNYLKSFSPGIKWNEICLSVREYLYYQNINKMSSVGEYKALKFQLKKIITDKNIIQDIEEYVKLTDKIVSRTYEFIKSYVLNAYENKEIIPDVTDVDFISMAVRAITINDPRGNNVNENNAIILKKMETFYESKFRPIWGDKYEVRGMSQILSFCKIQMSTAYSNNIKMNYIKYLKGYIFAIFDEQYKSEYVKLDKNKKKEFKKQLRKQIDICINDVLSGYVNGSHEKMKCKDNFKKWIIDNIRKIVPENTDFSKKGIEGDLEKNARKYFEKMIFMTIELEKMKRKTCSCFPLRTSFKPSNIDIDTLSLITLFINPEKSETKEKGISKLLKDNITVLHNKIWSEITDLNKPQFKWNKNYKFDHHILTDGISVTVLFRHIDMCGLKVHSKQTKNDNYKYIDKIGETENGWDKQLMKEEMNKMQEIYTLVLVDPGKNPDLLFMCNYDDDKKNIKYFKYTTKQRLHEMDTIKHRHTLQKFKKTMKINEIEQKLSVVSAKTCILSNFLIYIKNKNEIADELRKHYSLPFIRKMNLRSHINKLRSESKLVNNIKRIFGQKGKGIFKQKGKEIMLIYGDWSRLSQMRGVISTPCIGLKRRLAEEFKIYNIDEFRTSCLDNITFKKNKNATIRNAETGKKKELHSVLVSNILKKTVGKPFKRFQNRNRNSVLNMVNIIKHYKKEGTRKPEFSRSFKMNTEEPNFDLLKLGMH